MDVASFSTAGQVGIPVKNCPLSLSCLTRQISIFSCLLTNPSFVLIFLSEFRMSGMNWDYDVIVVGGGPGGSTAARFCAKVGLTTLIIEKERLPRYKPCGGCLSTKTVHLLGFDLSPVVENTVY